MAHLTPKTSFKQCKQVYVSCEEFNTQLEYCRKFKIIQNRAPYNGERIGYNAYVEELMVVCKLTFKRGDKATTYITYLDDRPVPIVTAPTTVWGTFNRYYKVPHLHDKESAPFSVTNGLRFSKDEYEEKRTPGCYGYDLNSAFSAAMMIAHLPDTSKQPHIGVVKDGEVGFDLDGNTIKAGHYAAFIFPELTGKDRERINDFISHWYAIKKKAKRDTKRWQTAKDMLNFAIGYAQKYNCFIRAATINQCIATMQAIIDTHPTVIFANVDSLVSTEPLDDLVIGEGIGEWKFERTGSFAFRGRSYQWDFEIPTYSHVPKLWFERGWDILTDELPINKNIYKYDELKNELIKTEDANEFS